MLGSLRSGRVVVIVLTFSPKDSTTVIVTISSSPFHEAHHLTPGHPHGIIAMLYSSQSEEEGVSWYSNQNPDHRECEVFYPISRFSGESRVCGSGKVGLF